MQSLSLNTTGEEEGMNLQPLSAYDRKLEPVAIEREKSNYHQRNEKLSTREYVSNFFNKHNAKTGGI